MSNIFLYWATLYQDFVILNPKISHFQYIGDFQISIQFIDPRD